MEQSANCIKETSSSGFYPEEPPGFFLQEAGSPSLSQWSSLLHIVHLSWAQTGGNHHEGFGMMLVLEQALTSATDHSSLSHSHTAQLGWTLLFIFWILRGNNKIV